jgi:ATP-dependent Clp protease ATP-binding subunit ClpB
MISKAAPKWLRDIAQLLPVRSQFVLSGNIRDSALLPGGDETKARIVSTHAAIWETLAPFGFKGMLVWDLVDGIRAYPSDPATTQALSKVAGVSLASEQQMRPQALQRVLRAVCSSEEAAQMGVALIIDFSSRLRDESRTGEGIHDLFVAAEKAALTARPYPRQQHGQQQSLFNPVIWLANRANDLPYWLTVDNERVRSIPVPLPDADTRFRASAQLWGLLDDADTDRDAFASRLSALTHNMSLNALQDIVSLAQTQKIPASSIEDAVQSYRVGDMAMQSPWRGERLRQAIAEAEAKSVLSRKVRGQQKAVTRVLDILKRTSIGLTGAQVTGSSARPRGVLFFAGPTGVGKTEMAKSIAEVVFGDPSAYLRFDMSEFSAEHSGDRLIGAPPGYVGFDQGGELTNAMRERPFRVLLFDEIEKAHHRILDKFLQILEDGRLTDGRGETVYFSDALIIFTSNLGISRELPDGRVEVVVTAEDARTDREAFEKKILGGIKDHFHRKLQRPEILNRIGENVVVFNFIDEDTAAEIMDAMIANVAARLADEHGVELRLSSAAREQVQTICARGDLSNGGRGIGSKLEAVLVNPLARHLFAQMPSGGVLTVTAIREHNGIHELECQHTG